MLDKFVVYQKAKEFYWVCQTVRMPPLLRDQLLRASSSIALNLAEGSGKRTANDQRRFYSIAFGSLLECKAILELEKVDDPQLKDLMGQLGAILFKLSKSQPTTTKTEPKL